MSNELFVYVRRAVDRASLDAALNRIEAPIAAPCEPSSFAGAELVEYNLDGLEGLVAGGFLATTHEAPIAHAPASLGFTPACAYSLVLDDDDRDEATFALLLALAEAGEGRVFDPSRGALLGPRELKRMTTAVARWRRAVEKQLARLSPAEREERRRRPGESVEAFRERRWIAQAEPSDLAQHVKRQLAAALEARDETAIEHVLSYTPSRAMFIEPVLDPCARAERGDVARRFASRFSTAILRAHFLSAVAWVGPMAERYAKFLVGSGVVALDASLRAEALAAAADRDVLAWLRAVAP